MVLSQEEISVKLKADIRDLTTGMKEARRKVNAEIDRIKQKILELQGMHGGKASTQSYLAGLGFKGKGAKNKALDNFRNQIGAQRTKLAKENGKYLRTLIPLEKQLNGVNRSLDMQNAKLKATTKPFAGYAMSIMFAGMAIQRIFTSIWKSSTKTFQEISHSVEGSTTGFDMLQGSIKYLGYSVGHALEPLAMALIPLLDNLSEFISKNEKLTASIIKWGTILGTVFLVGGSGVLAINGFTELAAKMGLVSLAAGKITAINWGSVAGALGKALAVGFTFQATADAYKAFKEDNIIAGISDSLRGAGMIAFLAGKKGAATALIGIGVAMDLVDMLAHGQTLTRERLAKFFTDAGKGAIFIKPGAGAALITIGYAMQWMSDSSFSIFLSKIGIAFGYIMLGLSAIMETILAPLTLVVNGIITIINSAAALANRFGLTKSYKPIDLIPLYNMTEATQDRIDKLKSDLEYIRGESWMNNLSPIIDQKVTVPTTPQRVYIDEESLRSMVKPLYEEFGAKNIFQIGDVVVQADGIDAAINEYLRMTGQAVIR